MVQPHAHISTDENGILHAISEMHQLTILPDGEVKAFNRNAKRFNPKPGQKEHERWLVGELDGVRVYISGSHIVMTKQNLRI